MLMKLLESIPKIGEAKKGREKVVLMRGLLLFPMMSPWLNIWRGEGSLCGDRKIKC